MRPRLRRDDTLSVCIQFAASIYTQVMLQRRRVLLKKLYGVEDDDDDGDDDALLLKWPLHLEMRGS